MVSTRKKQHQHKKQLSQFNETLSDFVIGNNTSASAIENGTLEFQANSRLNNFGRVTERENSACHSQFGENIIDDKIGKAVDSAVMTVENWMHDAILTAMDNMVIPRVKMAVRSITESSRRGPNSVVQNPNHWVSLGILKTLRTPLMSASSRIDLNVHQDRNDETRNVENFEDGNFPALRLNYDRRAHNHHSQENHILQDFCRYLQEL